MRQKESRERERERESLAQFVQQENGWSSELWELILVQQIIFCAVWWWQKLKVFRMKKSFEVSWSSLVPLSLSNRSPLFGAWSTTVVSVLTWLAADNYSEREARLAVVVGEFIFPPFLFPFQLGFQKSEKVRVAWMASGGGCVDLLRCLLHTARKKES